MLKPTHIMYIEPCGWYLLTFSGHWPLTIMSASANLLMHGQYLKNYAYVSCRQESLANAEVSARQQCVYEGPYKKSTANERKERTVKKCSCLHLCRWQYTRRFVWNPPRCRLPL